MTAEKEKNQQHMDFPAHFQPIILPPYFAHSADIKTNTLPGPKFSRQDLERLASDAISPYFGEWFKPLEQYARLIRMPEPPLLLADRVLGIDAEPGSLGCGMIWTETDVIPNAWYLHQNRVPAGIMIEAGQADLLLASWLGFDSYNRGERVYRLLGCDLSYHGELPQTGDRLHYKIQIDGQAKQDDIRLFFFQYDCFVNGELRLRMRNGQAGFFSDKELASSKGILWDAKSAVIDNALPLAEPFILCQRNKFNRTQLEAFSRGDVFDCFGPGFERTLTHTRTPCINSGDMLLLQDITDFDVSGGPWKRGYMRAIQHIHEDDWFFKGHFKNDPCMPGTLMFEAGLQLMAIYLTALGYTLHRDGWRFEPVLEQTYRLRCRGQVLPSSKQVVYEIFVNSVVDHPIPTIWVDLLSTADGIKSFHTKIGLRLVPDWPLNNQHHLLSKISAESAPVIDGFCFDYHSLLACALGKPANAFGKLYKSFDNHRRVPRLPGPPYHFISRIIEVKAMLGHMIKGSEEVVEYDVPADAWYFQKNGYPTMPFCVLLESALQPCGWLASFIGSALCVNKDVLFRNLDGTGKLAAEIIQPSEKSNLRSHIKLTNISQAAGMLIESFQVKTYLENHLLYDMETVFGFFPPEAFENQPGLPTQPQEKHDLQMPSNVCIDLTVKPKCYFSSMPRLAEPMLLMLDCITGYWPDRGQNGLGLLRAEKRIDPKHWFFSAHFFTDPVQPGSLGLEAMLQLLQFYMLHENLGRSISEPHFEPLAVDTSLTWKYRGQVTPENQVVHVIMEILKKEVHADFAFALAKASLWVDGKKIYEANDIGMRIVAGDSKPPAIV